MINIFIRIFELVMNLFLINYSLGFFEIDLPFWSFFILFVYVAFAISRIKIHFTFIDAVQIPVIIFLAFFILGYNISYLFSDYGNIPLYVGIIGFLVALPRLHSSITLLRKV